MKRISLVVLVLILSVSGWAAQGSDSPPPPFAHKGDELRLTSRTGVLVLSSSDGHIVRLADNAGKVLAGPSDGSNLWVVEPGICERNFGCFQAGPPVGKLDRPITSSNYRSGDKTFSWLWDPKKRVLTLFYNDGKLPVRVRVEVSAMEDIFRFVPWVSVDGPQSVDFQIPSKVRIDYRTIERFHVPNDYAVALTPQFFKEGRSFSLRYPVAFGDLALWTRQDKAGPIAIYRSELDKPFMPSSVTVHGGGADPDASRLPCMLSRTYHLFAKDAGAVRCPQFDIAVGKDLRTVSRRYGQMRQLGPTLSEKLPKDVYEKLIRSVILKYSSSTAAGNAAAARSDFDLQRKNLSRFPSPAVIHIISYLYYGFDRGYPDYLPPAESGGGPQAFASLIDEIHKQGKLWMPHTNPTFWNMVPDEKQRIPYKNKDDLYFRDQNGKFMCNGGTADSTAGGRIVSPMHPTVVKTNQEIFKQFKETWKTDIIFNDQMANRWGDFDFNKNVKYPVHSYIQQLTDLAAELKKEVPLAMEGGFDLQVPNAVIFHALSWPMKSDPAGDTDYNGRYGKGGWAWSPMFMYAVHDRVISSLHNLGDSVDDEQRLGTVLALGYSIMSNAADCACDTLKEQDPKMRWLWWLDAVQKNVCARYLGQELLQFQYIDKYVIAAEYPNLKLWVNLTNATYDLPAEKVTLAPFGWYARSDDQTLQAGHVLRGYGQVFKTPVNFIRVIDGGKVKAWLHGEKETIKIPNLAGVMQKVSVPTMPQRKAIIVK